MPDKNNNYLAFKKLCLKEGLDLFGVADISDEKKEFALSQRILKKLDRAISLGLGLSKCVLEELEREPTRLYFHHYRSINTFLDQATLKISLQIQRKGYSALAIPASQILDWQNQRGHLSHKRIGYLAGLGWIGRNNLLVNEKLGSGFRLATILTDMPLKADEPTAKDCGKCRACIRVCPAGAIKDRPVDFDHLSCFEKLKEFQKKRLVDQYICGVCINACLPERQACLSADRSTYGK